MTRSKIAAGFLWAMVAHVLNLWPGMVAPAHAQGSRKDDIVFNSRGVPLAGAIVRVCAMPASGQPCTPLALIYSDAALTQALANPTTTDGLGNYFFYAAPGKYEIEFSGPGITSKQIPNVILPSDPTSPNFSTISSSGGISAFSLNLTGNLTVNGNTTVVGNLASGTLNLANQSTAPGAAGTGTVNLYTKTTDKRLYYKDDTGTEIGPIANTTGAQTNVTNTFTAQQNFDGNIAFKGPNPWFDITRYGGYSSTGTAPSTTGNITSGTASLTLTAAQDFANGQGIVVYAAGAAPTMTTPGTPTVTPAGILNGATTYNYKVIAEDRLGGLTAASAQGSTTTGAATVGVNSVTLTQGVRTGGVTTYTSSANHNFQAGATISITGFNGGLGTFFDDMNGTKVIVATPTSTTFTVNDATLPDRTDSSSGTASIQACNTLTFASGSYSGVTTLRYWIYRNNALVGVAPGQDPFYIDCGITAGNPPGYVPSSPPGAATPEYLVSTIVSGGGTTTLTLANNAGATVSAKTVLHDNSLPLKAAAQAAYNNGGGTVYIPATVLGAFFPFNATTDFTTGISNGIYGVRILINNALTLNQTLIPRQGMDFEGMPTSTTSFSYVPAAPIGGSAHPFFYLTEGNGNLHFNRLQFNLGPALQSAIFADNGADGGGTVGIISDDVYFMGNNGNTRPVVLKGGFDFFFKRGECSAGNNVWPITYCVELTDSSPALTGANTPQIPGRVEWAGGTFVNTGVLLDSLPNNSFGGGTHIAFSRILFESAVAPFARINMNNGSGFTSQWVFNDVLGADLAVSVGTPFIDGTNSSNLQRVTWLDGLTAAGNQPLYVNGTPGSSSTFYVARAPSSVITNVPYTNADTSIQQLSNAVVSAFNGGRVFYQMSQPAAPTVSISGSSGPAAATYFYSIMANDALSFTTVLSPASSSITVNGSQGILVSVPAQPNGWSSWTVCRGTSSNPATHACSAAGAGFRFTTSTLLDSGSVFYSASPPLVGTAGSSILSSNGINTYNLTASSGSLTVSSTNGVLAVDGVKYTTIQAAINALPASGGTVFVPHGTAFDGGGLTISNPIDLKFDSGAFSYSGTVNPAISCSSARGVIIEGAGRRGDDTGTSGTTISITGTAVNGITASTCNGITVRDFNLLGPGSGSGKGVVNSSGRASYERLNISGWGSDGWTNDGTSVNSNTVLVSKVRSSLNGGNGFVTKGSNGQLVTFLETDGSANTGDGYNISNQLNIFQGTNGDTNATNTDYHFVSGGTLNSGTIFSNQSGGNPGIKFDSGANNNYFIQTAGNNSIVSDSGTANTVINAQNVQTTAQTISSGNATLNFNLNAGNGGGIQGANLVFEDNGTIKWSCGKTTTNSFACADPGVLNRFEMFTGGATSIHAGAGSTVDFNSRANSGNGGIRIFSGGASPSLVASIGGSAANPGVFRGALAIADQGTACANGNIALSAGWGTTPSVTAAAGTGQTCQFTLTSAGTGQATNATITDTLPTALPTANTVCTAQLTGGTGVAALSGAGLFINQTTLSATAPVFTFPGLPAAGSTYFVVIRCGP